METTIKQTTINTVEVAETDNAIFDLVVTRVDGAVSRVVANISMQQSHVDDYGMTVHSAGTIGSITYANGNIATTAIPASGKLPNIVSDFLDIINAIKERTE